jgi:hypothetical protein
MARSIHPSIDRSIFQATERFYTLKKLEQMISQLLLKMMMMTAATQARYLPTHPPTRGNGFKNGHGKRHAII